MRVSKRLNDTKYEELKGRSEGKKPFVERLRSPALLLGWISILLAAAACAVYFSIYHEGDVANQNAQNLLTEYKQALSAASSPSAPTVLITSPKAPVSVQLTDASPQPGDYAQPGAPDVDPASISVSLPGYDVIGKLTIEKIGVELPVIARTTTKALKVSVCYYGGALPGEPGNMVITGHYYANGAHFGKLGKLIKGDPVEFETTKGKIFRYVVYEIVTVTPDDTDTLNKCKGDYSLTLVTCASNGNRRLIVRCKEAGQ